jgi:plasmid stabilization system protein ParE
MITIEFHPEADRELSEAKTWYRERSTLAARAFATDIAESLRHIAESPTRWPEARSGERRYVLSRFPF